MLIGVAGGLLVFWYLHAQAPDLSQGGDVAALTAALKSWQGFHNRPLLEAYLPKVGIPGLVEAVRDAYPVCHDEAHDLGKVIYAELHDTEAALAACENVCSSGCMHGVMMELFAPEHDATMNEDAFMPDHHIELADVKEQIKTICTGSAVTADYREGDCLHGVGHAVMFMANYDIPTAMDACSVFDTYAESYYCATGAYMEYMNARDADDAETQGLFYPCDNTQYPSACFRYKMPHVTSRFYVGGRALQDLVAACEALEGNEQLGCFHGIGNGHLSFLVGGQLTLGQLCQFGTKDEQFVCIEGAMERMSRYYPDIAEAQCASVEGWQKDVCEESVAHGMYDMDKSFELYPR